VIPARFRDLSLKGKVTLTLVAVFLSIATVFLLVLLPLQREQRLRILEQEKRLISTLRDKYQRDFIYDILSENEGSLAVDVADLARQVGILWVRVESDGRNLSATADPVIIQRLLGADVPPPHDPPPVLLVGDDGRASFVGSGGRPLPGGGQVAVERLGSWRRQGTAEGPFREVSWSGETALYSVGALQAANEVYGRLHIVYSLAALGRSETLTRTIFYGLAGTTFVLLLLLLNLLISRIVIGPVQRVLEAMSQASRGELDVRLPVHSRDEIGTMAASFNRMVEQLEVSKGQIEGYSRNLERRVEERTRELRESEEKLLAVKNHLATVIANVATGVLSLDEAGRVTTFNDRAAEILGVRAEPAVGRTIEEVLVEPGQRALIDFVATVRDRASGPRKGQLRVPLPQGLRTLSLVASPLRGEAGRTVGTVVVFDDLTQLLSSQRLEAWKEAVEKVIHEIKNPLTPVGLAAQTLRSAYAEDRAKFDEIFPSANDMILRAVKDLKDLIADFAQLSRLPKAQLRLHDVNALVADALAPYQHGEPDGIRVRSELAPGLPRIEADADQLKRVLLNVLNNAIEAMDERGGELRVTTGGPDESGRVRISVRDEGSGVEDVERAFEPHYTTKVKGTGLGLAIARQIVEEHHGRITVESRLGHGTTVRVHLPAG
jgi:PAS domain S-box-containing protein